MTWQQEQSQFWRWINQPQNLATHAGEIAELLAPHSHLSQAEALSIYNNAYHQRLVEVSTSLFPILFNTLGRDLYTRLWIGYIGKYPPRNGPIHRIGEHLLDYVRSLDQFRALPAVADIVQLESLLISLFDVADEAALTLAELQALPVEAWPTERWHAKQDWALLESRFDLEKYWRLMQQFIAAGGEPGTAAFGITLWERAVPLIDAADRGQGPLPQEDGIIYLVYRNQHRMQFQAVAPALGLFLRAVQGKETFAGICEHLACFFPAENIPQLSVDLLLKAVELQLLRSQHQRDKAISALVAPYS